MKKFPSEQQEQFVLAHWLRLKNIPHHHSPNGGYRNPIEAAKFKRLGTSPGFPDIFIPEPRKGHHGLFLELKRVKGGVLSESQAQWGELLIKNGYAWHEPRGAEEAINIITDYLGIK